MTVENKPYAVEPVLDRVLQPFEKWADSGYAEGVIEFVPSLGREPLLMSPGSVSAVFQSAITGLGTEDPSEADKREAARRFEFIERFMDGLMTRENRIRDRYHASRRRGMLHRTLVMLASMGLITAASVTLPAWCSGLVAGVFACAAVAAYRRFSRAAAEARNIYLFEERHPLIIRNLPWMGEAGRISPRPPLGEAA